MSEEDKRLKMVRDHLEAACINLTQAMCMLRISEGKYAFQHVHRPAYIALRQAELLMALRGDESVGSPMMHAEWLRQYGNIMNESDPAPIPSTLIEVIRAAVAKAAT